MKWRQNKTAFRGAFDLRAEPHNRDLPICERQARRESWYLTRPSSLSDLISSPNSCSPMPAVHCIRATEARYLRIHAWKSKARILVSTTSSRRCGGHADNCLHRHNKSSISNSSTIKYSRNHTQPKLDNMAIRMNVKWCSKGRRIKCRLTRGDWLASLTCLSRGLMYHGMTFPGGE